MNKKLIVACIFCTILTSFPALAGAGFQSGNILVAYGNVVSEYDFDGNLVSQLNIPSNAANEISRDLTVLDDGRLAVYNGTFYPELAIYDGVSWQSSSIDGWSTVNNVTYGGITTYQGNIIVTDSFTYSGGEAKGLISIDVENLTNQRFAVTEAYIDVTLGRDGLLYALRNTYGDLDVYDPATQLFLHSVDLGHTSSSRGIAVNAIGDIFMVSLDGYVAHYNASGELLNTLPIASYLSDIELDSEGRVIVGSVYNQAYITDETLSGFLPIAGSRDNTFVAFVPLASPGLTGSHTRKGRWVHTTLSWTTAAPAVDIYFNGELIDTESGVNSATYSYFKKLTQAFKVCNAGTLDCSVEYVSNIGK